MSCVRAPFRFNQKTIRHIFCLIKIVLFHANMGVPRTETLFTIGIRERLCQQVRGKFLCLIEFAISGMSTLELLALHILDCVEKLLFYRTSK